MDCSPPGRSVHGILQGRILEWVAIPCSRGSFRPRDRTRISCVSCIGRWVLYHQCLGRPNNVTLAKSLPSLGPLRTKAPFPEVVADRPFLGLKAPYCPQGPALLFVDYLWDSSPSSSQERPVGFGSGQPTFNPHILLAR